MADALGVRLQRITVSGADIAEAFPEVVRAAEKPMLRTAPGPLLRLSRAVREAGFKVVLTGEGADELFGGYGIFQEAMIRRFWARQPDSRCARRCSARLPLPVARPRRAAAGSWPASSARASRTSTTRSTATARASAPLAGAALPRPERARRGRRARRPRGAAAGAPAGRVAGFGPLGQAQYLEIHTFLTATCCTRRATAC
jgi:asparagine synthase (glutamine-hydrolysing)